MHFGPETVTNIQVCIASCFHASMYIDVHINLQQSIQPRFQRSQKLYLSLYWFINHCWSCPQTLSLSLRLWNVLVHTCTCIYSTSISTYTPLTLIMTRWHPCPQQFLFSTSSVTLIAGLVWHLFFVSVTLFCTVSANENFWIFIHIKLIKSPHRNVSAYACRSTDK